PNELSARQLMLVARWLERFSTKARVVQTLSDDALSSGARPVILDLAAGRGALRPGEGAGMPSDSTPYLDVKELARSIRKRLGALSHDDRPGALGLGEDVSRQLAESLLTQLHRLWCEDRVPRAPGRRGAAAGTTAVSGLIAMHYFISGLPFRQPGEG